MLTKRVLGVGNCDHDHSMLKRLIDSCGAQLERSDTTAAALARLTQEHFDLVLVNRMLDADNSYGIELVKKMQVDPKIKHTPIMLISNLSEAQAQAVALGAQEGFGKDALDDAATKESLKRYL